MGAAASRPTNVAKEHEVVAFMNAAGLQAYADGMASSGFDDMETLLAIEDADIKALGFTPQHAALLKRKLREHQGASIDENHPVVAFLKEAGLAQYAEGLLQNGWDDMETLAMIDDEGMKELGFPRGHVLKLRRRLREFQERQGAGVTADCWLAGSALEVSRASSSATTASTATAAAAAGAPSRTSSVASSVASSGASWDPAVPSELVRDMQHAILTQVAKSTSSPSPSDMAISTQRRPAIVYSWEQVKQMGTAQIAFRLYENFVNWSPEAVALFSDDSGTLRPESLRKLFAKLITYVGSTVAGEYDVQHLVKILTKLSALRVAAGVSEAHWKVLGQVLDVTLQELLGDAYTAEVQRAWMAAYGFMSSVMADGFRAAVRAPSEEAASGSEGELDS